MEIVHYDSLEDIPKSYEEAKNEVWNETGFYVVGKLTYFGTVESIHIIFDMFPTMDDGSGNRIQYTWSGWGTLPTSPDEQQLSCAKIGNRLGDFGWDVELKLTDMIEHPVELVRVVRTSDGSALRITVDE